MSLGMLMVLEWCSRISPLDPVALMIRMLAGVIIEVFFLWKGRLGRSGFSANLVFYECESLFGELGRQSYGVHRFPGAFHLEPDHRPHESLFQSHADNVLISVDGEIGLCCI